MRVVTSRLRHDVIVLLLAATTLLRLALCLRLARLLPSAHQNPGPRSPASDSLSPVPTCPSLHPAPIDILRLYRSAHSSPASARLHPPFRTPIPLPQQYIDLKCVASLVFPPLTKLSCPHIRNACMPTKPHTLCVRDFVPRIECAATFAQRANTTTTAAMSIDTTSRAT
ncbi:hypothetical protein C8R43DRAFT_487377 [Mycena crocata]|nr:hypothetical protein C8R43DRAFT_487377 [Mycena crocata]